MSKNVSQDFEKLLLHLSQIERERNGQIITGSPNERKFRYVRDCLCNFTQTVMKRDFNALTFDDIDKQFLQKYVNHLNGRNVENKLQKLRRVFREANADTLVFDGVKIPVKFEDEPLSMDHTAIERIEFMNRDKLTEKEELHLDLFLFSYYAGGMSAIDVCLLTRNQIKDDLIIYDRTKYDKQARVIIIDKAAEIIERYRTEAYMNYVFPTIKRCNPTQQKLYGRVKRINEKVNETLRKICDHCGIKSRVTWGTARSSYISKMIDEGFHPLQVAELAGNSPQTIYRHCYTISDKEKVKEKMNEVFC